MRTPRAQCAAASPSWSSPSPSHSCLAADDSDECWDRTRRCSRARISRACVSSVGSSSWAMSETTRPPYITCFSAGKCLVADSAPYSDGDVHAPEGHFGGHPGGQESASELIPLHGRQPTHTVRTVALPHVRAVGAAGAAEGRRRGSTNQWEKGL